MRANIHNAAVIHSELAENPYSCASGWRSWWELEGCCLDVQITPLDAAKMQEWILGVEKVIVDIGSYNVLLGLL